MKSIINKIYYKEGDYENYPEKIFVVENIGIKNDNHSGKVDRNLSLAFSDDVNEIEFLDGLCTKKFKGNITLNTRVDVNVGDVFNIGEALIEITYVGKRCFDGCNLLKNHIKCPLKNAFFAKVIKSGNIEVGSIFYKTKES